MSDLVAFLAVARRRSFTRAAAQLRRFPVGAQLHDPDNRGAAGGTPSDPHDPERLRNRSRRAPASTSAAHFDEIESEIAALGAMRDKPAGTIRITTIEHAAETILWPAFVSLLAGVSPTYNVEIISEVTASRTSSPIATMPACGWGSRSDKA